MFELCFLVLLLQTVLRLPHRNVFEWLSCLQSCSHEVGALER